jgi:hypothetical protein
MQWTIKSFTPDDLSEVCAVLVAGVVFQSVEIFFRMKSDNEKTVAGRIGNLRSKH